MLGVIISVGVLDACVSVEGAEDVFFRSALSEVLPPGT